MHNINKLSYIRQISGGKWRVYSNSGKDMGTYDSKEEAKKRLDQIEMFKHMDKNSSDKLPLDGCTDLITQIMDDFLLFIKSNKLPNQITYKISSSKESKDIISSARLAAFYNINDSLSIKKISFDSRRVDQKFEKNPRVNLQYYNRSEQFIDAEKHRSMVTFGRLIEPLNKIKNEFGDQPEYFQSYSMDLHDLVSRVLRVKEGDLEVFSPQLDYLKQLLFARYRLSMESINKMSEDQIKQVILSKDEALLKRGDYLKNTSYKEDKKEKVIKKDNDKNYDKDSIISAIFGNNDFRRDGEKKVERTITITIKDEVMD